MPWFMVDDDMTFHPKTIAAGNEAMGMWVRAGSWCQKQMNGGVVPAEMASALGGVELADRLVASGLWAKTREGYRFHQWDERQLSKVQIENRRKAKIEAGRKGGIRSGESRRRSRNEAGASSKSGEAESGSASFSASISGEAETSSTGINEAETKQVLKQTGSPVPCTPLSSGSVRGVSHLSGSTPPPGNLDPHNPRCPDHSHIEAGERGPNCIACGRVRKWCEGEPDRRQQAMKDAARRRRECPHCDESGLVEMSDGRVKRCTSHEEIA